MRHGEVFNPKKILYGRLPRFFLSQKGQIEVKESVNRLMHYGINHIYSSPLLRCRQSAQIAAKLLRLNPKISILLNEDKLIHQGMSIVEYKKKFQPYIYQKKYLNLGQESIEQIRRRMIKFIRRVVKRHEGEKILVISHGDPILILKTTLDEIPFTWKYKKENYLNTGQWIRIECDNKLIDKIYEKYY